MLLSRIQPIVASDVIIAFSPSFFRVSGTSVTRLKGADHAGCFTKPLLKGIHRMSIKTQAYFILLGVCDSDEYPKHLTTPVYHSTTAALMNINGGGLFSAKKELVKNTTPQPGQELSAEADLEKRTLHFFIDGVQQQHHFVNIPVPLVFAIDAYHCDVPIDITFWGEETQSHVTFEGTGHNLG
ncbi:hypothetical protein BLNAU_2116 [Blattamonas nauphoetae]|uniref:Uncharacterized protein n=1 Tax=Blattamonas nauphoetae TaxID=2049346 RepID=A0ABQ9YH62_9EUKA|nr:hypothetical protein BLNAU_2116 [Blattamonas nauphoetae]